MGILTPPVDCERRGKFWRGCKFQAVMDSGEAHPPAIITSHTVLALGSDVLDPFRVRTFAALFCVSCGRIISRKELERAGERPMTGGPAARAYKGEHPEK